MPGSFLAKFHDACPITASISSALIDLPSIKEIQVRFGGKEHVPHPFPAGRSNSKTRTEYVASCVDFLDLGADDFYESLLITP